MFLFINLISYLVLLQLLDLLHRQQQQTINISINKKYTYI